MSRIMDFLCSGKPPIPYAMNRQRRMRVNTSESQNAKKVNEFQHCYECFDDIIQINHSSPGCELESMEFKCVSNTSSEPISSVFQRSGPGYQPKQVLLLKCILRTMLIECSI